MSTIAPLSHYVKLFLLVSFITILAESISETILGDEKRVKKAWKESNLFLKITNLYILKYDGLLLIPCITMVILWHVLNIISIISLFLYPKSVFLLDKLFLMYVVLLVLWFITSSFLARYEELKIKPKREKGKELTKEEKRKRKEKKKKRKNKK